MIDLVYAYRQDVSGLSITPFTVGVSG